MGYYVYQLDRESWLYSGFIDCDALIIGPAVFGIVFSHYLGNIFANSLATQRFIGFDKTVLLKN
jgi:hypothetical protein